MMMADLILKNEGHIIAVITLTVKHLVIMGTLQEIHARQFKAIKIVKMMIIFVTIQPLLVFYYKTLVRMIQKMNSKKE